MLTQKHLEEVLEYSLLSGRFYWKRTGKKAGTYLKDGRIQVQVGNKLYKAHRLAWLYVTGNWPDNTIDHINRVFTCNGFHNLRDITVSENQQNISKARKHNSCGFLGVSYDKERNKYAAKIRVNNKYKYLGRFDSPEEAHEAYMKEKKVLHPFFEEI